MVESLSLEGFKGFVDVALGEWGSGGLGSDGGIVGLDLGGIFQPEGFSDALKRAHGGLSETSPTLKLSIISTAFVCQRKHPQHKT